MQTIILTNPTASNDPIFLKDCHGYLFPRVYRLLKDRGIISNCVISMPSTVPNHVKKIIEQWDIPCIYSSYSLPQHRANDIANKSSYDTFLLLTPYFYMLEQETLEHAFLYFQHSGIDTLSYAATSSSSHFALCNKKALQSLAEINEFAVTPFSCYSYTQELLGENSAEEFTFSKHNKAHAFLSKLLYQGNSGILPNDFITGYYEKTSPKDLFSLNSYYTYISDWFAIADFDSFSTSISPLLADEDINTYTAQLQFAKRLIPFIPNNKNTFLELGFGKFPTTSIIMLNLFKNGIAVEPYAKYNSNYELIEFISKHISLSNSIDLRSTTDCESALKRLTICENDIDKCEIENNSVDFIFSKTVFEHVKDVKSVSEHLYNILSPGGIMYHIIDHRDHTGTSSICFDFIKHDKQTWAQIQTSTNLWRINDFIMLWEKIGFKVTVLERISRILPVEGVHPCWNEYNDDDLYCYHSVLLAEKPTDSTR